MSAELFVRRADLELLLAMVEDIEHRSFDEVAAMRRLFVALGHDDKTAAEMSLDGCDEISEVWS
jgi:hypothetical protein